MKKSMRRIGVLVVTLVLITGLLNACSKSITGSDENSSNSSSNSSNQSSGKLSGTITMAGSTSMEKLANAASEAFMQKYPGVTVTAEFTGSGAGIEAVTAGTVNIGNSSRSLTEDEKNKGLSENIVAIDGIAIIADKSNKVTNLTKDQLVKIYKGEITNWKDIGGANQPIVVIGREAGSGTRDAFEELLSIKDVCKYSNQINSTGGVMAKVASTPGSIGYVSLDVLNNTVTTVSLDGVQPTEENIKAKKYILNRPFVMATKGKISEQSQLVQEFFKYLQSDEGRALIKSAGLINVDKQ